MARAKFIPNESGTNTFVEGTTNVSGCVVLSGIQSTEATVELLEKTGYVTPNGSLVPEPRKLQIAPNITTHTEFKFAEGGAIQAKFTYKGLTTWEGKEVKSDTFVAYQTLTGTNPKTRSAAPPSRTKPPAKKTTKRRRATTPLGLLHGQTAKYPSGDLFDFSSAWTVWAGDCSANKETVASPGGLVVSGKRRWSKCPSPSRNSRSSKAPARANRKPPSKKASNRPKPAFPRSDHQHRLRRGRRPAQLHGPAVRPPAEETLPGSTKGGQLESRSSRPANSRSASSTRRKKDLHGLLRKQDRHARGTRRST